MSKLPEKGGMRIGARILPCGSIIPSLGPFVSIIPTNFLDNSNKEVIVPRRRVVK